MKCSPKFEWRLLFAVVVLAASGLTTRDAMCGERPNVLLFFVDDMGSDFYETSSLARLAAGGLKFSQAYAMPLCSPSRACLMTARHGASTATTGTSTVLQRGIENANALVIRILRFTQLGMC